MKYQNKKTNSKHKRKSKHPGRNKHHLKPRSRGGNSKKENLLLIDIERHVHWHQVFNNMTLVEVISLLHRVLHAKHYETVEPCPFCKK